MSLRTDYKDAIPASGAGTLRKYQQIDNGDGTFSFQDVTEYSQAGDKAQAGVFNEIGEEVNSHTSDATVHLQAGERDKWNAAAQYPARTNPPVNLDQMFIPVIQGGGSGVMEIGQHIDFHVKGNNVDYDARLTAQTDGSLDGTISHAKDTASLASALTLSTAAPTSTLAAGKLWGVYDA